MSEHEIETFGEDTIKQTGIVRGFDIKCIESEKISEKSDKETWGMIVNIELEDGTKVDCTWEINNVKTQEFTEGKRLYSDIENITSIPFILGCCGADKISELVGKKVIVAMTDTALRIRPESNETNKSYWSFTSSFDITSSVEIK